MSHPHIISRLEIIDITTLKRQVVFEAPLRFEAPNWTLDNQYLIINSNGLLFCIPATGGTPEPFDTGFATRCNNDHVLSPDNSEIAISHHDHDGLSKIYIVPFAGGTPRQITPMGPSYLHGWSPDGQTLAYCAERNGQYDIYTIPVTGGKETQLTNTPGLDDGPEYSADGKYIYFNSVRTGQMQVWRMLADGSDQEQLTFDEANNWFPHPSPDGKKVVFLTYHKEVDGHPANQEVQLRLMPYDGGEPQTLAALFGGQGTINVHSWANDSQRLAFVSYQIG